MTAALICGQCSRSSGVLCMQHSSPTSPSSTVPAHDNKSCMYIVPSTQSSAAWHTLQTQHPTLCSASPCSHCTLRLLCRMRLPGVGHTTAADQLAQRKSATTRFSIAVLPFQRSNTKTARYKPTSPHVASPWCHLHVQVVAEHSAIAYF
jgi:hypothetical protein